MRTESQRVPIPASSPPAHSARGARTDWFRVVPLKRGGGDIVATVSGVVSPIEVLDATLYSESGDPLPGTRIRVRGEREGWTWPAPQSQLCRIVFRAQSDLDSRDSVTVEQVVEDPSSDECVVLTIQADTYASKLFQITAHAATRPRDVVRRIGERARFVPSDSKDHLATRHFPLPGGTYEIRIDWQSDDDPTNLLVRPQLRNYAWLPTRTSIRSCNGHVRTCSTFNVPANSDGVRLCFLTAGETLLPDHVELVRLTATRVPTIDDRRAEFDTLTAIAETKAFAAIDDAAGLERVLATIPLETVESALSGDPWLCNYAANVWEYVHGRSTLTTYPTDICIPIADVCNARCTFCTSWLEGTKITTLEQIEAFAEVLRYGRTIGLAGHGEPLAHPRITEILALLEAMLDPRSRCYVITNGVYLDGLMDDLIRSRVTSVAVSLNAATSATHEEVMGLPGGSFDRVLDSIRALVSKRRTHGLFVSASLVVTQHNVHEVAAFVELGNSLGLDKVQLKTLAPAGGAIPGLNYHVLPPYLHPDYAQHKAAALAAIRASRIEVQADPESWDAPVFPQDFEERVRAQPIPLVTRDAALSSRVVRHTWRQQHKYEEPTQGRLIENVLDFDGVNPFGRTAPFGCRAPFRFLYINDFSFNVSPCCYLPAVPGAEAIIYDGTRPFMDAWNSEALVTLRRRLRSGPLFNMCTKCPASY